MSTETKVVAFFHEGDPVTLDWTHKFYVESLGRSYETAEQAKAAIDRKAAAEKLASKEKLDLAVIDEQGIKRTITGVHAGRGDVLIKPKSERYGAPTLYPACEEITSALETIASLHKQAADIHDSISKFALATYVSHRFSGDIASRQKEVKADYERKLEAAKEKLA